MPIMSALRTLLSLLPGQGIFIYDGIASPASGNDKRLRAGYTKEGESQTPNTCYESSSTEYPHAMLDIPHSEVRQVKLMASGE